MSRYERFQNRLYDALAHSGGARGGAIWLRNVSTQILAHRLASSIDPDRNGEALLQRRLANGLRVAIDVGANRGEWTANLLACAPKLEQAICYEPALSALSPLRERFAGEPRVQIVDAALADVAGAREFFEEPQGGETSSLVNSHTSAQARPRPVRVVTIDDELDRLGIAHVDLLKVDAEGMDLHVLRGAQRALREHRVATVQFEYGGAWAKAGSTLTAAFVLLRECGYAVGALLPDGVHDYEATSSSELFVYANFVAYLPNIAGEILGDEHPALR